MSYSKFASVTASLVARNGQAAPALVAVTTAANVSRARGSGRPEMSERRFVARSVENECVLSRGLVEDGYTRWRSDFASADTAFDGRPSHRGQARKVMVAMTDAEYEALDLIAAKTGSTRHQVVRSALNGYFKWLADEYASTCRCISMLCSNAAGVPMESRDRPHPAGNSTAFPRAPKRPL